MKCEYEQYSAWLNLFNKLSFYIITKMMLKKSDKLQETIFYLLISPYRISLSAILFFSRMFLLSVESIGKKRLGTAYGFNLGR